MHVEAEILKRARSGRSRDHENKKNLFQTGMVCEGLQGELIRALRGKEICELPAEQEHAYQVKFRY